MRIIHGDLRRKREHLTCIERTRGREQPKQEIDAVWDVYDEDADIDVQYMGDKECNIYWLTEHDMVCRGKEGRSNPSLFMRGAIW